MRIGLDRFSAETFTTRVNDQSRTDEHSREPEGVAITLPVEPSGP